MVVSFTKADPKGNILAGAKLRVLDENGKELLSWTSGAEPYVVKGKLIAGKSYTLVEDEAPSGYEINEDFSCRCAAVVQCICNGPGDL